MVRRIRRGSVLRIFVDCTFQFGQQRKLVARPAFNPVPRRDLVGGPAMRGVVSDPVQDGAGLAVEQAQDACPQRERLGQIGIHGHLLTGLSVTTIVRPSKRCFSDLELVRAALLPLDHSLERNRKGDVPAMGAELMRTVRGSDW
jgi:hypothetical protein